MLFGYETKQAAFERLIKTGNLFHSYLFYGDAGVGKKTFARLLAAAAETGKWEKPARPLLDSLFLAPGETGSLGIDAVATAKNFLWQKPIASPKRCLIVSDGEALTPEAEGALLKAVEEPPEHALLIFVARSRETLLPPLLSRLQKIYFPRLPEKEVEKFLVRERNAAEETARRVAAASFGSIGRALEILGGRKPDPEDALAELRAQIIRLYHPIFAQYHSRVDLRAVPGKNSGLGDAGKGWMVNRAGAEKNAGKLKWLLERETLIARYNLNMKLQKRAIESILNE